jgi:hypothetical protein
MTMAFSVVHRMSTYFTSLFLAKVGSGGNTPRTVNTISGKFSCGSLPQIMLIWVFRKILPEIPWLTSPMTALLIHQQEKRLYELICTDEQKSDLSHSGVRQKMTSSLHKKKKRRLPNLITRYTKFQKSN